MKRHVSKLHPDFQLPEKCASRRSGGDTVEHASPVKRTKMTFAIEPGAVPGEILSQSDYHMHKLVSGDTLCEVNIARH